MLIITSIQTRIIYRLSNRNDEAGSTKHEICMHCYLLTESNSPNEDRIKLFIGLRFNGTVQGSR